jgi:hypothetical protein
VPSVFLCVQERRADADRLVWKAFVEGKYGLPPQIEYLYSPVMVDNRDGSIIATSKEQAPQERCGACLSRGAIVMAIAERTSIRGQIAAVGIVIGVAVAAPVVIETVIAGPETKAETPVVIETPVVTEVTARPGKMMTCKAAAAHMAATEATAHVTATTATEAATTAAARKRVSGQPPCESGGRR